VGDDALELVAIHALHQALGRADHGVLPVEAGGKGIAGQQHEYLEVAHLPLFPWLKPRQFGASGDPSAGPWGRALHQSGASLPRS
jgi:hypothetical protein